MKMKKRWNKGGVTWNKSVSDLQVDFCCSQMLGSRSFSHDSIFLADHYGFEPEQPKVLSEVNTHGDNQDLQIRLKQKKINLGPLPLITFKQTKASGGCLENICLTHRPTEHAQKFVSQSVSPRPLGPMPPPLCPAGVDFSTLPQLIPCLDNSAARHRMSIKPRNQRASTKSRRILSSTGSKPRSESIIILEQAQIESENEEGKGVMINTACVCSYSSQIIKPGEGPASPPIKRRLSASSLKSPLGAKNTVNRSIENISPTPLRQDHISMQQTQICESKYTDGVGAAVGTWQALKSAEGMTTKTPSTTVLTIQRRSADQQEALNSSKLNSVQNSKQSLELNETRKGKESHTITIQEKNEVKEVMHQHNHKSQPIRPLSLNRNISTLDKVEARNVQQTCTVPLPSVEGHLQKQMVPDKRRERQYTVNHTGPVAKGALFRDTQVVPGRDPLQTQTRAAQPVNQIISQQRGHNQESLIQLGDGELNTSDAMEDTNISCQRRDEKEWNALGVKLHTTSLHSKIPPDTTLSEFRIKQTITEVCSLTTDGQTNIRKDVTSTLFRNPQITNTNPAGSRALLESSRDKANFVPVRLPDLEPSVDPPYTSNKANIALPSLPLKEVMMNNSVQTNEKQQSETSNEQSWMEMALEKTRSLQQLFSSRLNEFAGLQTTTRPATSSKTQISTSNNNAGPINQILFEQSSVMPQTIGAHPPHIQSLVKTTASTVIQSADMQYSLTASVSATGDSEAADFSVKQYLSRNIHQRVQPCAKPGHSSETYVYTTEDDTPCRAQEQLSQTLYQPPCPPELIFHQHSQLSPSPILYKRQQLPGDWTSTSQRKSSVEQKLQWVGTLASEQRHIQKHHAEKVADQKSTINKTELDAKSSDSHLRAVSGNIKLDKEDKCQRKTVPSSPPQSFTDSGQPSWMELAKKKSMAWSDKTVD